MIENQSINSAVDSYTSKKIKLSKNCMIIVIASHTVVSSKKIVSRFKQKDLLNKQIIKINRYLNDCSVIINSF
jgi:hypothetical protein